MMNRTTSTRFAWIAMVVWGGLLASAADAHFAWLATDEAGHPIYFFGESVADQTYHLPDRLAEATVIRHQQGEKSPVALKPVESDSFVGRKGSEAVEKAPVLTSVQPYGLYQGSMLVYHSQHQSGAADQWPGKPLKDVPMQAVLRMDGDQLTARILRHGKPLEGVKVQLFCEDGHEEGVAETNEEGETQFSGSQVEPGLNGLLVGYVDNQASGQWENESYTGEAHYLTVTFRK